MNKIHAITKRIPKGMVASYKSIAKKVGMHPRSVARILAKNFNKEIPCHRVVYSNGKIGGYNKGILSKKKLLKSEGIKIKDNKIDAKYFYSKK